MPNLSEIRQSLIKVFDDNLHTKVWHSILDYTIISLIVLSTVEVFLTTFPNVVDRYGAILHVVDITTTIFFTIEVSLRIWVADGIDPKYKGFKGRIRYCFSFYGLLDIVSTYPAFFTLIFKVPISILKIIRVVRLMRIFRYMKSFRLLGYAIKSKKQELGISFACLGILTIIFSFLLFYAEHNAQPDLCENAWSTLIWAFAKYLGDPGKIADYTIVSPWGNVVAALVGVLGIAIFAVPAGLIGSGFIEAIEDVRAEEKRVEDINRLRHAFRFQLDQISTRLYYVPPFVRMNSILVKQFLKQDDVIDAVMASPEFHLYNLSSAYSEEDEQLDRVVVVNCPHNRPYGCCIDRNSNITIVGPSGHSEPLTNWVAYHLAKIGGFNYVSKEIDLDMDNPTSFYNIVDPSANEHLKMYLDDVKRLSSKAESWVIPMCFCVGPKSRPHKIHLCFNGVKKDNFEGPLCIVSDTDKFLNFAEHLQANMEEKFSLLVDRNLYYGVTKNNILHHLPCNNGFALRIEGYVVYFAGDKLGKIKEIADCINLYLLGKEIPALPPDMLAKPKEPFGYRGYQD